ncbi:MAG TPA: hypothetical protein PLY56_15300, partial [Armatimonadota bacterium]|nr:hypothetical protein [Armatimonadota bacterium]
KGSILKWGGLRLYRTLLPFFLGLILGDIMMGCLWSLIGIALGVETYSLGRLARIIHQNNEMKRSLSGVAQVCGRCPRKHSAAGRLWRQRSATRQETSLEVFW